MSMSVHVYDVSACLPARPAIACHVTAVCWVLITSLSELFDISTVAVNLSIGLYNPFHGVIP